MAGDDAFAIVVALDSRDRVQTGWAQNPAGRNETMKVWGIAPKQPEAERDPMLSPPPAHLAEDQLAEFRALMSSNPTKPPD
jgi:hypothetical protein